MDFLDLICTQIENGRPGPRGLVDVPKEVLKVAGSYRLKDKAGLTQHERMVRAYNMGLWAQRVRSGDLDFKQLHWPYKPSGGCHCWVVLTNPRHYWTGTRSEVMEMSTKQPTEVVQGFASQAEGIGFCAGAGLKPGLPDYRSSLLGWPERP